MTSTVQFPTAEWEARPAEDLGFDADKLEEARLRTAAKAGPDAKYRVLVVRGGFIAAEWNAGFDANHLGRQASAAKSVYACLLGVAVAEGKVPSSDARVAEVYPEMLQVPEGSGPKPGRCNKPEDEGITFRHLITNPSGYLKPGELPGKVHHYQTFGMNVLMHAIGKIYGVYDAGDPEKSTGPGELVREKLRDPIGGSWTWRWTNFDLWERANLGIFGYYTQLLMTALDQARLGWLWRNEGNWRGTQVIPADWMRQITVTAPDIRENAPEDQWCYGHGFWTNDHGKLWPSLPRDSYAASGAGRQYIWVCPSLDLVVCHSPGLGDKTGHDTGVTRWIVDALRS